MNNDWTSTIGFFVYNLKVQCLSQNCQAGRCLCTWLREMWQWFHSSCVRLSSDDFNCLFARKNCFWVCGPCLSESIFTSEDKFPFLTGNSSGTVFKNLKKTVNNLFDQTFSQSINENLSSAMSANLRSCQDTFISGIQEKLLTSSPNSAKEGCSLHYYWYH